MRIAHLIALLCALFVVTPAAARMYEWVNPVSGRVQLSGTPPTWYRTAMPGPRVRVFEDGALVDDTAIDLSAEEDDALREVAMARVEQRRQLEALRQLEIATQREAALREAQLREAARLAAQDEKRRQREAQAASSAAPSVAETVADTTTPDVPEALDTQTIERLKALISEFDRIQ